jgi:hypothetical protein
MPKTILGGSDAAISLRLPRELLDRLKATAGNGSVSEEIRQRLEASFVVGPADPPTHRFADTVAHVAHNLDPPWHKDPFAFAAFAAAIAALLAPNRPEGTRKPKPGSLAAVLSGPHASPKRAGKTLAAMAVQEVRP